jgi:hypothetical protein
MPEPTPEERAAAAAVSRLGQQHPTERPPRRLTAAECAIAAAALRDAADWFAAMPVADRRRLWFMSSLRDRAAELERGNTDAR